MISRTDILAGLKTNRYSKDAIKLAAYLGHTGAQAVEPGIPPAPATIELLIAGIAHELPFKSKSFRHIAMVRAALAMARLILPLAKKRRAHGTAEAFYATGSWTLCPCSICEEVLEQLCLHGVSAREPLALQVQYDVAGVVMNPFYLQRVLNKCSKLVAKKKLRAAVIKELSGWALLENDPVRATIGDRIFWLLDPTQADPGVAKLRVSSISSSLYARLEKASRTLETPQLDKKTTIAVTRGKLCDMVPNDHGLIIVSERLKTALEKIKSLAFASLQVAQGSSTRSYWLVYSLKPVPALLDGYYQSPEYAILDPSKIQKAPVLFRLKDEDNNRYLIEKNFITALIQQGIRTGIYSKGTAFGCGLK